KTRSAPSASAAARCCGLRAVTRISPAPPARAARTAARPIVPAPSTSTRCPSDRPATRTPCTATPSGSDSAARAKATPPGTGKQGEAVPRGQANEFGEAAGNRHPDDPDERAVVVDARLAVPASPAAGDPLEGDAIPGAQRRDRRPDLGDLAGDLVPRTRLRHHHLAVVPVQVGAADAAAPYGD